MAENGIDFHHPQPGIIKLCISQSQLNATVCMINIL